MRVVTAYAVQVSRRVVAARCVLMCVILNETEIGRDHVMAVVVSIGPMSRGRLDPGEISSRSMCRGGLIEYGVFMVHFCMTAETG